jgi:hypothetical protein
VIAPIAGLGGGDTAVPMAAIVLALVGVSFAALRLAGGVASPHPVDATSVS